MKKGLSVLLIAAALFGFYGGAVNLNDVLACKDYWEEEGEKSTADMNKLEDGLNQLKDNEQAYLDGLDAVAEGEEALAQGEQDYADGQATLAKGEADYAAAPGKLADARKQIAQGEKDLAAGENELAAGYSARSGLDKLISGLEQIKTGYNKQWKPGFETELSASELQAYMTGQSKKGPGLKQARQVIVNTLKSKADDIALVEKVSKTKGTTDSILNASSYKAFDSAVVNPEDLMNAFATAKDKLEDFAKMATGAASDPELGSALEIIDLDTAAREAKIRELGQGSAAEQEKIDKAQKIIDDLEPLKDTDEWTEDVEAEYNKAVADKEAATNQQAIYEAQKTAYSNPGVARKNVKTKIQGLVSGLGENLALVNDLDSELYASINSNLTVILDNKVEDDTEFAAAMKGLVSDLNTLSTELNGKVTEINNNTAQLKTSFKAWDTGYKELVAGETSLADPNSKLPFIFKNMLSNSTIREVIDDKAPALVKPLTAFSGPALVNMDVDMFDATMNELTKNGGLIDNCIQLLKGIRAEASKKLAAGENELAAGRKKLANGKAQYAQGLADYKAAPAKLAAGRAALAEGLQKLMDGRKELAAGKDKLAEYEDGEQQVRDGLATLMGTEPNGGLESILDRRSGDDDFDNGDEHLDLDEGLDAVDVGRGYQADSGELITKEITNRAIGTAAGLGAAALAVLAAILSFLKKNKGAGVLAILSAAAGGAGIAAGTSAGMEFSSIAGSAVGATPWVAFGILAGVAAVHAIAHFASKEA